MTHENFIQIGIWVGLILIFNLTGTDYIAGLVTGALVVAIVHRLLNVWEDKTRERMRREHPSE